MPWLLREGDVLAAIEEKRKGWQKSLTGAVVLTTPSFLHTMTPSAAAELDVAWCVRAALADGRPGYSVKRISAVRAHRLTLPQLRPGVVIAAPAGTFHRWKLAIGDLLEVRGS